MFFSILLLVILIFINGIFSASEIAFLSLDKFKLKKEIESGNKKAIKIKKLIDNSSLFLSTIQIGITLAGFLASAFAADYFADYFLQVITIDFFSISTVRTILVVIITVILSYFTLVFGELVPKKIAINYPFKIAYMFVNLIRGVMYFCYPLIKFLTFSTNVVCKVFNIKEKENKLTEEDMFNIFQFNDTEVKNVMTPKKDVVALDLDDDIKVNIAKIKKSKFTRFPIYKDNIDNIIGVLNVKDLIMQHSRDKKLNVKDIMRPVSKFSFDTKIDDVFRDMQEARESIAIVVEGNKFIGIVTLEDAIEEIVGNIYDEHN